MWEGCWVRTRRWNSHKCEDHGMAVHEPADSSKLRETCFWFSFANRDGLWSSIRIRSWSGGRKLSRERGTCTKRSTYAKPIWTAITTSRKLSSERGTWEPVGTTAFIIRKFKTSRTRRRCSSWWTARTRSNTNTCPRWSHGRRSSWSMGSRRSSRWWFHGWTGNMFFYFCINSLGPVWGRHCLFSKWRWTDRKELFRWEDCCPSRMGKTAWTSESGFEMAVHWTCWLGEATMDRTSLLSFHKIMGDRSTTLTLQESWQHQLCERAPRWMSILPYRLDERSRWAIRLGWKIWHWLRAMAWTLASVWTWSDDSRRHGMDGRSCVCFLQQASRQVDQREWQNVGGFLQEGEGWTWKWTGSIGIEHFWIWFEKSKCSGSHEQEDYHSRSREALLILHQDDGPCNGVVPRWSSTRILSLHNLCLPKTQAICWW